MFDVRRDSAAPIFASLFSAPTFNRTIDFSNGFSVFSVVFFSFFLFFLFFFFFFFFVRGGFIFPSLVPRCFFRVSRRGGRRGGNEWTVSGDWKRMGRDYWMKRGRFRWPCFFFFFHLPPDLLLGLRVGNTGFVVIVGRSVMWQFSWEERKEVRIDTELNERRYVRMYAWSI